MNGTKIKRGKAGILVIGYSTVTEVMFAIKLLFLLLLLVIRLTQSRQQCQRGIYEHNVRLVSYSNLIFIQLSQDTVKLIILELQ